MDLELPSEPEPIDPPGGRWHIQLATTHGDVMIVTWHDEQDPPAERVSVLPLEPL